MTRLIAGCFRFLDLDPVLRPSGLTEPVAAFRHQAFQYHFAADAKQVGTNLRVFVLSTAERKTPFGFISEGGAEPDF
jgi:hypothetical protein